jgi:hypothetical protein
MGTCPIELELGRYRSKPLHERLCNVCKVLEDEDHFLNDCPRYDHERNELYGLLSTKYNSS